MIKNGLCDVEIQFFNTLHNILGMVKLNELV